MSCCEICDRNPGCGTECGSCHFDVCPECRLGVLHEGVATLPNECCAAYFLGRGTWGYAQWQTNQRHLAAINSAADVLADQIRSK